MRKRRQTSFLKNTNSNCLPNLIKSGNKMKTVGVSTSLSKTIVKIVEKIVNTDGRRVRAADFSVLEEKEAGTKRKSELSV